MHAMKVIGIAGKALPPLTSEICARRLEEARRLVFCAGETLLAADFVSLAGRCAEIMDATDMQRESAR